MRPIGDDRPGQLLTEQEAFGHRPAVTDPVAKFRAIELARKSAAGLGCRPGVPDGLTTARVGVEYVGLARAFDSEVARIDKEVVTSAPASPRPV